MKRPCFQTYIKRAAFTLAAMVLAASAHAAPLEAYGRLPALEEIALSPDGRRLAYVSALECERIVLVQELESRTIIAALKAGADKLRDLAWAGPGHLLVTTSATSPERGFDDRGERAVTQIYDVKTRAFRPLLRRTARAPDVLLGAPMVREVDGKTAVFVMTPYADNGPRAALFAVDVGTGERKIVDMAPWGTLRWIVDAAGVPIAKTRYDPKQRRWTLEMRKDGAWVDAFTTDAEIDLPAVAGLSADGAALVIAQDENEAVVHKAFRLADAAPAPAPGPDYDGALLRDPVTQRIIGAARRTMEKSYVFFSDADRRNWQRVAAAFPGEHVEFVSWSNDRTRAVVHVAGPRTGVAYALVDLSANTAAIIGQAYADIAAADVAPVSIVTYKAADGLDIPAYLTRPLGAAPKALPLIVLAHGGPAARDAPGFDWWAQAFAARGFAVLQPQFRGSDGLGNALQSAGYGEWGRKMQSDLSDGVRHLAGQGLIDPARVCIVGASYGGYAALAGMTFDPDTYRCGVSVAGVSDVGALIDAVTRRAQSRGLSYRYLLRYTGAKDWRDPLLEKISPVHHAANVKGPILLLHGRDDTVVEMKQTEAMHAALTRAGKPVQFVALTNEDHWLSRPETRLQMLTETMAFVEKHNPAQ